MDMVVSRYWHHLHILCEGKSNKMLSTKKRERPIVYVL